jgi:hypothetical protein
VKFGSLVATCEGCGCAEILQPSLSKRTFMRYLNRFIREHRMHEYKKRTGEWKPRKVSKPEQHKRTLRHMPTYGVRKH